MRRSFLLARVAVAALMAASGCVVASPGSAPPAQAAVHEPGPPPHAPAHGYRRKHAQDGEELVFDSGVGVYVVVGVPDCWWDDAGYYRWANGVWSTGLRLSGPWTAVKVDSVPPGLRGYQGKKARKGNGNPPASRRR